MINFNSFNLCVLMSYVVLDVGVDCLIFFDLFGLLLFGFFGWFV